MESVWYLVSYCWSVVRIVSNGKTRSVVCLGASLSSSTIAWEEDGGFAILVATSFSGRGGDCPISQVVVLAAAVVVVVVAVASFDSSSAASFSFFFDSTAISNSASSDASTAVFTVVVVVAAASGERSSDITSFFSCCCCCDSFCSSLNPFVVESGIDILVVV